MEVNVSPEFSVAPGDLDCRILLVEDDYDHRPLLSLMLRKCGSNVTLAENGKVAVDMAAAAHKAGNPFDMIVMDLQMPVLDGMAATRIIRADGYTKPIIALTARAISSDRDKCIEAGCDDFLSKPISRTKLAQKLHVHLTRSRAARADAN